MEHVSTLCAVSTVGIAATGFALARRENRTGLQSLSSSRHSTIPRNLPTDTNPFHSQGAIERPSQERTGFQPVSTGSGQSLVLSQRRRERRRRQTVTNPLTKSVDETSTQDHGAGSSRPSSSWLRRISIISSATASSVSSPTTTTSFANDSPTQAHTRRNSTVKTPNKLIKRSVSQRSITQSGNGIGRTRSTTLGLRRPATSHQRSSDIAHRSSASQGPDLSIPAAFLESSLARENDCADLDSQYWRPYFGSTVARRRKSSTGNAIVTIKPHRSPNPRYPISYPTLILSSSVQTSSASIMPVKQSSSQSPSTATVPFIDPFSRHNNATDTKHTRPIPHEKRRTVRSSSISDLSVTNRKPRNSPMKGDVNKSPLTAVRLHGKDRIVSNPLPRESGKSGSPRLRRKRNFTMSDTLSRPQTAPNANYFYDKPPYSDEPFPQDLASSVDPLNSTESSLAYRNGRHDNRSSPINYPPPGTSPPIVRYSRNKRLSGATSDWASTVIGSDDTRVFTSADEDDQSDSVFDSFRTRISSNGHTGRRGPRIETIFYDVSSTDLKDKDSVSIEELGLENLRLSQSTPRSSLSDIDSNTTPLALSTAKNTDTTPTAPARYSHKGALHSSPSKKPQAPHSQEVVSGSDEDAVLDDGDDDFDTSFGENINFFQPYGDPDDVSPSLTRKSSAIGTRASVFDWSEQTWSDRDPQAHEVRPSTVHGKQGPNARSTRRANRKAPSTMHLRSQSVPVSRDGPVPSESRQPSAKFGTWGLGQKGVSEDWDGDFDFGDEDEGDNMELGDGTTSAGRLHTMKVPQAIMESQASVHGQYGQVQELTLLVEELKRLRIQGNALQVINGPANDLWKEADGIVNLATFEDEESNWQVPDSPSSCGSFDDFEISPSPPQKAWRNNDNDMKRPPLTLWSDMDHNSKVSDRQEPATKVKSVLETIYQQRESLDARSIEIANQPPQKLPFDTQSLKELVARAGVVTRALKDVIRKAEGVTTSNDSGPSSDPPFSQIFAQRT
ncbi:conserved hypothetical protein [Talaromyces stipitatus ATCC 10500]|uniref:Uncharacterized protein n=1 Tax=Talaromyces stipitatus (strain ATCC 10500 / CBS 375.48 / QM 6759 / NRRL 1006) TaxID=441959 RepID=B8LTR2_TALSN|nr:uncharacterized protein TSTA_070640 [Talaromyces stipitatus ATCC 10500]EED23654.1 conserved hypothetical protein [Talaromyces stipitatus ATCC 10500]